MSTGVPRFGARLAEAIARHGRLCVGIDPHPHLLQAWGLNDDVSGLREFGSRVLEAAMGRVGVIKPQVAFFERRGPAGLAVLAELQQEARREGLLVIADAKRGDIGSTMAGYADAWLAPEAELAADALTVSPYLGFGSLRPALEVARRHGAGLFVLALTSNPEGREVQLARTEDGTVASRIAAQAAAENPAPQIDGALGDVGLVVGATTAGLAEEAGVDLTAGAMPLLAPGFGAQGATAEDLRTGFAEAHRQVVVNSSRGILAAGPDVAALTAAVRRTAEELAD
ncbi:orotidine-5'-phosphate decarboxylase [Nesterenkonia xinjiangensis]|uniref:Orotidine 5'-phosphate decarboxylase n=1 Tax=Nesterenkonia xinjiangensis TaxID=225327 RepID=A0A7Z0KA54_9MICC|nr:orotidine-5'-phosphate decarboxylase [Nesterenkonia xinjiangensis]NYJ79476.1 orotidine-5'-phosphate decarboxylase [Nesterenkonia xinjiangensis]